ncbi:MAG: 30S ribosomal protein S18 [Armatimonadota bacterium]
MAQAPRRKKRRKHCAFCVDLSRVIDYKNVDMLADYLDDRGRIRKARQTGTCRKHQNRLSHSIKRAREMALLPYEV